MSLTVGSAAAFVLISFLSLSAQDVQPAPQPAAQPTNKPMLRDLSPVSLIRLFYEDEKLRAHFAPSKEQIEKFEQLFDSLDKEVRALQAKYTGQEPTQELIANRQKELVELQKKLSDGFSTILSPEELKSFNVVRFQILGGFDSPMANSELLSIFGLTQEQTAQINAFAKERQGKIAAAAEILRERPDTQEQARERMMLVRRQGIEISREYGKKLRDLLTAEQQAQADKWLTESPEVRALLTPYFPQQTAQPK